MTMYQLPIDSEEPHARFEIDLDETTFALRFDWSDREEAWYFSVELPDGTQVLDGRKVVIGCPMLRRLAGADRPKGDIVFVDTSGTDAEPGRNDLGDRVLALYADAAEIAAL